MPLPEKRIFYLFLVVGITTVGLIAFGAMNRISIQAQGAEPQHERSFTMDDLPIPYCPDWIYEKPLRIPSSPTPAPVVTDVLTLEDLKDSGRCKIRSPQLRPKQPGPPGSGSRSALYKRFAQTGPPYGLPSDGSTQ